MSCFANTPHDNWLESEMDKHYNADSNQVKEEIEDYDDFINDEELLNNISMKYKVIISAQIDVEADSIEEAEQKAIEEFDKRCEESLDKFGLSPHEQLQFDAILDDIQDEEINSLNTKL